MNVRARWLLVVAILAVAAAVAVWPRTRPTREAAAPPAPDLVAARAKAGLPGCTSAAGAMPDLLKGLRAECLGDGSTVDAGSVVAGRAVLVNVWATWCEPCKEELPVLADYASTPGAIPVLGVALKSPDGDALELLAALHVRLPSLRDVDGSMEQALKPAALPASYLVGADGSMRFVSDPRVFTSVDAVRAVVGR